MVSLRFKERLIIYSPDEAAHKDRCLKKISQSLPDFQLVEIKNITFDHYMELATRCMFSITFGEGLDGYLSQPFLQGGVSFAVFNNDFFPCSPDFRQLKSIFLCESDMLENIVQRITALSSNQTLYESTNIAFRQMHDALYNYGEYQVQIKKLAMKKFDTIPRGAAFDD
jgi:hypothetical protein